MSELSDQHDYWIAEYDRTGSELAREMIALSELAMIDTGELTYGAVPFADDEIEGEVKK